MGIFEPIPKPKDESVYLTLPELQRMSLDTLLAFDEVCRKHDIEYIIAGGSLLGAVRHHGFIPWDDDCDVSMLRDQYEKLISLTETINAETDGFRLIHNRDGSFARDFIRWINLGYAKYEPDMQPTDCPYAGLDIFAMDRISDSNDEFAAQVKKRKPYVRIVSMCSTTPGYGSSKAKTLVRDILRPFAQAYGAIKAARKLDEIDQMYSQCGGLDIASLNGMYGTRERWPLASFHPVTRIPFEDTMLPAPARPMDYLTAVYGEDCMEIPPEEKRKARSIYAWKL